MNRTGNLFLQSYPPLCACKQFRSWGDGMLILKADKLPFQALPGIYPLSEVLLRISAARKESSRERQHAKIRELRERRKDKVKC